jgi:hypothetical protein
VPAVIPFIRFGERMQRFSGGFARGVFAWSLFAVPAAVLLFVVFRPVVRTLMPKQQGDGSSASAAAGAGAGTKKD